MDMVGEVIGGSPTARVFLTTDRGTATEGVPDKTGK